MSLSSSPDSSLAEVARASGLVLSGGYLNMPPEITRVKIDVGLSWDAGQTTRWLADDPNLAVIGVEPIPSNLDSVREIVGKSTGFSSRLFLLPVALADQPGVREFFVTKGDKGSSSLYEPLQHEWEEKISVRTFTLSQVIELVDPSRFARIDYLKTDCQGSDLDIVRGAGEAIQRIAVVTVEAENLAYAGTSNSEEDINSFFASVGFKRLNPRSRARRAMGAFFRPFQFVHKVYGWIKRSNPEASQLGPNVIVEDPTFLNQKFHAEYDKGEVTAYQKG